MRRGTAHSTLAARLQAMAKPGVARAMVRRRYEAGRSIKRVGRAGASNEIRGASKGSMRGLSAIGAKAAPIVQL
jgi:hypothetical protein